MFYSLAFLLSLILAPLLVHLRDWKPAALFFAVAAVYAAFGIGNFAYLQITLNQNTETDKAYQDTYYVVAHGHYLVNAGIQTAIFGAITWVQTRFGSMKHPKLTKTLFWLLNIALIGNTAVQGALTYIFPMPRSYVDYPDYMQTLVLVSSWSGLLSSAVVIALLCLLLWSIMRSWLFK